MMWIVKIALRAPYTFTVLAVLLLIGGALSTLQMAKDIFPAINIPVVGIIWTYANPDGRLFDGLYAQAKFALKNPTPALLVPDNSIANRESAECPTEQKILPA